MQHPYRARNQLRKKSHVRVRLKELGVIGEKCGIQPFEYSRKIDFGVFYSWMVAIQKKSAKRQTNQNPQVLDPEMRRWQFSAPGATPSVATALPYVSSTRSCLSCRNRKFP